MRTKQFISVIGFAVISLSFMYSVLFADNDTDKQKIGDTAQKFLTSMINNNVEKTLDFLHPDINGTIEKDKLSDILKNADNDTLKTLSRTIVIESISDIAEYKNFKYALVNYVLKLKYKIINGNTKGNSANEFYELMLKRQMFAVSDPAGGGWTFVPTGNSAIDGKDVSREIIPENILKKFEKNIHTNEKTKTYEVGTKHNN